MARPLLGTPAMNIRLLSFASAIIPLSVAIASCSEKRTTSCVARGTRIRTPRGDRLVEELSVGDEVLAFDLTLFRPIPRKLAAIIRGESRALVRMRAGGSILRSTPEHPLWVPERRAWVPAG